MRVSAFPYYKDSVQLFKHIAHRPYAIFLDSGASYAGHGRFDILSADPKEVFIPQNSHLDPFTACQQILSKYTVTLPHCLPELPFTIGAIGYFAYDAARRLETLPNIAKNDIDLPDVCIGFYDWSLIIDHHQQKSWLITSYPEQENILKTWFTQTPSYAKFDLTQDFKTNMPFSQYKKAFDQLQQHIQNGNCYEANLCQRFTATYRGSPWFAYETIRQYYNAPYSAYFNLGASALLSFSPERFIRVEDHQAKTQPIKGTRPRSNNRLEDQRYAHELINSLKDRAENLMIVDLLRNDFGKCCIPGSIQVPKLFALKSFHHVHHLVSTITGILEPNQHSLDLLRHCFPGGSITGAPKISAMSLIETLEPHRRSLYCGTIGYIDIRGHMDCNITIRSLICHDHKIHGYAGGAIVSDSICEEEYQETLDKINPLLSILKRKFLSPRA